FKSGQLVPLAVTSPRRSPLVPDVPSVTELGYANLVLDNFFGLSGPAHLPTDVMEHLNKACNEVLALEAVQKRMLDLGVTIHPSTSSAFASFVREQVGTLAPTVRNAGVRL
ncbi:Bug family tripartite tricarboxylate transporter substrate binding protein, partial [Leptospira sp. SA-E8]|uniref:Bug family tripartite tricarboxylate transporter substrate binding protein n=1 Tax=Leptospira sp. SA-E8 TaxID=3422259 RepID=UPI003EBE06F7